MLDRMMHLHLAFAEYTADLPIDGILAPHKTGGCDSPDPHTMSLVDKVPWENRGAAPAAIAAELRGPKGRGQLPMPSTMLST